MARVGRAAVAAALALSLASPPAGAVMSQDAVAVWLKAEGKDLVVFVVLGTRYVDPLGGGVTTAAGVARGKCEVSRGRRFRMVSCVAFGRLKEIPFEDFVVDPTLGEATVEVTMGGVTHAARWTASDLAPTSGAGVEVGPWGAGAGAGMARAAEASGSVFGRELEYRARYDFADLSQGGGVFAGLPVGERVVVPVAFRRPRRGGGPR